MARPAVLREIDLGRHAVIEASAGTGKTYTLEHLIVELVLVHEIPLEQILVVTFTDKATREMRERVRQKLRAILDATEDEEGEGGSWAIDERARRRLGDALAVFDRAPISTIHAFCQRVLSENAFDCARLLRQEQVESREVFGAAFRDELRVEIAEGAPLAAVLERALAAWGVERLEGILHRWYAEQGQPEPRFDRQLAHEALVRLPTRMELAPSGAIGRLLAQGLKHPSPKKEVPALLYALAPVVEGLRAGGSTYEALLGFWDWASAAAPSNKTALAYLREHLRKAAERARGLAPLAELVERLGRLASSELHVLVAELLPRVVARMTGHKSERGRFDFDDMLRMLAEAPRARSRGGAGRRAAAPLPRRARRRVPGHRRRAVEHLPADLLRGRAGASARRDRRSEAGHLRLPQRGRAHLPRGARGHRGARTARPPHRLLPLARARRGGHQPRARAGLLHRLERLPAPGHLRAAAARRAG
ncbi:MAG: UvrD-helicase domain-containing protein [Sandaracinaceae bacterium]|nr:UvrD-helicase domain-containing protein [Sandaracinaceae bacterium]